MELRLVMFKCRIVFEQKYDVNPGWTFIVLNKFCNTIYVVYDIESICSATIKKEEVKKESYVTLVIRFMWYAFESWLFIRAQIIIHSTYMYALIGLMHMIHGLF